MCCSFPAQQFLHVHHGGGHDGLVHGQDLGGSAGGGCWSPAGLALQRSSGVRSSSCPLAGAFHLAGQSQRALSCQLSPGSLLQASWLLNNLGWADFLALISVKPELDDGSGIEAEASEVVVLSLALKGQQSLQWGSQGLQLTAGLSFRLPIAFDLLILKKRWKSFLNWCVVSLILFLVSACNNAKREWMAIEGMSSFRKISWNCWPCN